MRAPATDIDTLFRLLIDARAEVKRLQEEIVARNVGLVVWALDKCAVGENLRDDCRSAAYKALLDCIKGFDPDRGFKFGSYAGRSLMRAIAAVVKAEAARRQRTRQLTDSDHRITAPRSDASAVDDVLPDLAKVMGECRTLTPDERRALELVYLRRMKPTDAWKVLFRGRRREVFDATLRSALDKIREYLCPTSTD